MKLYTNLMSFLDLEVVAIDWSGLLWFIVLQSPLPIWKDFLFLLNLSYSMFGSPDFLNENIVHSVCVIRSAQWIFRVNKRRKDRRAGSLERTCSLATYEDFLFAKIVNCSTVSGHTMKEERTPSECARPNN